MKHLVTCAAVAIATALATGSLSAQNVLAESYYGEITLRGGFLPDPQTWEVTAGGATSVRVSSAECNYGNVSERPDLNLSYQGDGTRTLYIYAVSADDTTLLLNLPSGTWRCDDDSYGDGDPILVIPNARSGLYNIWVGTYGEEMANARLYISEIDPR